MSEKLSTADWKSPKLMLINVVKRPLSNSKINAQCSNCGSLSNRIYAEHVRIVNKQQQYTDKYLCTKCLHKNATYIAISSAKSKAVIDKITKDASERSKKLWEDPTYRAKYADKSRFQTKEFKDKVSAAVKEKFNDPEYVDKIKAARKKYWQNKNYADKRCFSLEQFIKAARAIHGDLYNYDKIVYNSVKNKIIINCPKHGDFTQRACHHLYFGNGCPACAANSTRSKGEDKICEWLASLGIYLEQNKRDILPFNYELDIYIPSYMLGIEYHGVYWHSYVNKETTNQKYKNYRKASLAHSAKISLLQFYDYEWLFKNDIVQSMILNKLGMSKKIYARKCRFERISEEVAKSFFNTNHLSGYRKADFSFGLFYGSDLVSAISFKESHNGFEVMRFASALNTIIIGGLSKFIANCGINGRIFTYANRRYSNAAGYLKAGFTLIDVTKPDYKYFKNGIVYDRRKFQKHKLGDLLEVYDEKLTEAENMFNNKFRRFWGAGHYKLEIKLGN